MRSAIIVIPAADLQASNAWCENNLGCSDVFVNPLSANGSNPATHYWTGWFVTQAQWDQLDVQFTLYDGAVTTSDAVLTALSLQTIEAAP